MAQLMPLPLTVYCFNKIQIGLPFWYRLTWVVLDKGRVLNVCVCVCMVRTMLVEESSVVEGAVVDVLEHQVVVGE